MPGKRWTDQELGVIADLSMTAAQTAGVLLTRSAVAIREMRRRVAAGWVMPTDTWSEIEDDLLRASPHLTNEQIGQRLGRTATAVGMRRGVIGSRRGRANVNPWTVGSRRLLARTCPECGLFLDGRWFERGGPPRWTTVCARCKSRRSAAIADPEKVKRGAKMRAASARAIHARLQAATLPYAVNNRKEYTEADYQVLADPELTAFEKAIRLGRTYSAVCQMVHTAGYRSKVGRGDPLKGQWFIHFQRTQEAA